MLKRVGNVSYEYELPSSLSSIHLVFHVSTLRKCVGDPSMVIPLEETGILCFLSYEEVPVEILDQQVCRL